jgi:hypothetical protein
MVCFAYTGFSRGRICEVLAPAQQVLALHVHLFALGTQRESCSARPSGSRRTFVNGGCHGRKETDQKGEYTDCCSGDS